MASSPSLGFTRGENIPGEQSTEPATSTTRDPNVLNMEQGSEAQQTITQNQSTDITESPNGNENNDTADGERNAAEADTVPLSSSRKIIKAVSWFGGKVFGTMEYIGEGLVDLLGLDDSRFQDVLDGMTEEEMEEAIAVNEQREEEYRQLRQIGIFPPSDATENYVETNVDPGEENFFAPPQQTAGAAADHGGPTVVDAGTADTGANTGTDNGTGNGASNATGSGAGYIAVSCSEWHGNVEVEMATATTATATTTTTATTALAGGIPKATEASNSSSSSSSSTIAIEEQNDAATSIRVQDIKYRLKDDIESAL